MLQELIVFLCVQHDVAWICEYDGVQVLNM